MSARIISTVGRAIDVIVAGRLVSHLRFAAGVFVLAAGLLMGSAGGAVAVADPDSSGSTANSTAPTSQRFTPPRTARGKTARTPTRQERRHGHQARSDATDPGTTRTTPRTPCTTRTTPRTPSTKRTTATDTKDDKKDSGVAAAVPDQVAPFRSLRFPIWSRRAPLRSRRAPLRSAGSNRSRRFDSSLRFPIKSRRASLRFPIKSRRRAAAVDAARHCGAGSQSWSGGFLTSSRRFNDMFTSVTGAIVRADAHPNRDCTARGDDPGRSGVIAARDGTASAQ